MSFQSTTDPNKKFSSVFKQRRYDSYHAGEQTAGNNENEKAEPQESGASAADVVKAHGPAHEVRYTLDHEKGEHTVESDHEDGHKTSKAYHSPAEAFQQGGELAAADVKRMDHPDQQGAKGEEENWESDNDLA